MSLKLETVRTEERLDEVREFAASFQHVIGGSEALPIITASNDNGLVGYYHILQKPVISFAFHPDPDICSPRSFVEIVEGVKKWQFHNTMGDQFPRGICYALIPNSPAIPMDTIKKMGFEERGLQLVVAQG